jgi:hypothetical protein
MVSWKQYYAEHTKGKKFSGTEIREHMKKLGAEYRKMKSKEGKGMCEEVEVEAVDEVAEEPKKTRGFKRKG